MSENRAGKIQRRTLAYRWREFRRWFWEWLLEDQATRGLGGAPNSWHPSPDFTSRQHGISAGIKRFSMHFQNDAFDVGVWIQNTDDNGRWAFTIAAEDFRKLALWYLWRWAWGEWFGLRRKLFYRRLHWKVAQYKLPRKDVQS